MTGQFAFAAAVLTKAELDAYLSSPQFKQEQAELDVYYQRVDEAADAIMAEVRQAWRRLEYSPEELVAANLVDEVFDTCQCEYRGYYIRGELIEEIGDCSCFFPVDLDPTGPESKWDSFALGTMVGSALTDEEYKHRGWFLHGAVLSFVLNQQKVTLR